MDINDGRQKTRKRESRSGKASIREPATSEATAPLPKEFKPDSRLSPQVDRIAQPFYCLTADIPHILARVRLLHVFLDALDDRKELPEESIYDVYQLFSRIVNDSLAPYALDLARSLIALENSIGTTAFEQKRKGK